MCTWNTSSKPFSTTWKIQVSPFRILFALAKSSHPELKAFRCSIRWYNIGHSRFAGSRRKTTILPADTCHFVCSNIGKLLGSSCKIKGDIVTCKHKRPEIVTDKEFELNSSQVFKLNSEFNSNKEWGQETYKPRIFCDSYRPPWISWSRCFETRRTSIGISLQLTRSEIVACCTMMVSEWLFLQCCIKKRNEQLDQTPSPSLEYLVYKEFSHSEVGWTPSSSGMTSSSPIYYSS